MHFEQRRLEVTAGWPPVRVARTTVRAVNGVSYTLHPAETLGLVGESGCGKSTTARATLQLHRPTGGSVRFQGAELTQLDGPRLRALRRDLQMIFQDPYASLDPRWTVGRIIAEPLRNFSIAAGGELRDRVEELMLTVGLDPSFVGRYPHEFSGGQRQRIGIARALALEPKVIFCDEPVSALDVSIQAQIINLLQSLQERLGIAFVFIAHDLAVVRHLSHRVAIMYLGRIVETTTRERITHETRHPYSRALLGAVPIPDPKVERSREPVLLEGTLPSPTEERRGCDFVSRCPLRPRVDNDGRCLGERPRLLPFAGDSSHLVACHYADRSE
ncbi:MAG: ATP-binding cassette domain-containing protein [Planctomycetota bacterium]|nr:MAG: ATP-binding cassette domain-containing protein [Planctomycetota bacterium]